MILGDCLNLIDLVVLLLARLHDETLELLNFEGEQEGRRCKFGGLFLIRLLHGIK